ncbi:MAG: hypothetical protein ACAH95_09985 [Fimbriimonas sp.]
MSETNPPIETTFSGEGIAESFIATELEKSRTNLTRTRIVVVAGVALIGLYMVFVTNGFRENLHPKAAALITTSMVNQRLDDAEPQFAEFIRTKVPETIRGAPDYALARLPEYRATIEDRVEQDLRSHAQATSEQLSSELGVFLAAHKEQVEAMLQNPSDPASTKEMGAGLETQLRTYLSEQPIAGATIKSRLDDTLKALNDVEKRISRLAANKGLTPTEKKTRRAIANLMRRIDAAKAASPEQVLDPGKVKEAVKQLGG